MFIPVLLEGIYYSKVFINLLHTSKKGEYGMVSLGKSKSFMIGVITLILCTFGTSSFSSGSNSARIIPTEKVSVYRGNKLVGEFHAEAPFPEGALLACDGECAVKMEDLYLVGADKSLFSVQTKSDVREVQVKEGTLYFTISDLPRPMLFNTPNTVLTVEGLSLISSSGAAILKGYVIVTPEATELGVIEGGFILVSTIEGQKRIYAGKMVKVAQVDLGAHAAGIKRAGGDATRLPVDPGAHATGIKRAGGVATRIPKKNLFVGSALLGVLAGGAAALSGGGGGSGGGSVASPSTPP